MRPDNVAAESVAGEQLASHSPSIESWPPWAAWVFQGRSPGMGLYGPSVSTLLEGLESYGVTSVLTDGRSSCE
eukprot:2706325-Amphidinium_carterae.1